MDRYIIRARMRRIVIVILCFAALAWGIRQVSLTIKAWAFPEEKQKEVVKTTPLVPDGAKTIGEKFLLYWFGAKSKDVNTKIDALNVYTTQRVQTELTENSTLIPMNNTELVSIDSWDEQWVQVGTEAYVGYQILLKDGRTLTVNLPLIKSGTTWLVDGLPSLLPIPESKDTGTMEAPTLSNEDEDSVQEAVDGFFDSWLSGRKDQNTRYQNIPPTNLLNLMEGTYKEVYVKPIQEDPLIVSAVVVIETKTQTYPFEYQLELEKKDGQYTVKKVLGGK